MTPLETKVYEHLKSIRTSTTLKLKPTSMLRPIITDPITGNTFDLRLRYYQSQGIYHMLTLPRMILGDGTGLGKTLQTIGALCYQWAAEPDNKVLVVCPKSAIRQWESEVKRFTEGVQVFIATGSFEKRLLAYQKWAEAPTGPGAPKSILVTNYHSVVRDWDHGSVIGDPKKGILPKPGALNALTAPLRLVVIYDECTAFKNNTTKTWETCKFVSERAKRVYGLTATLLKNKLEEGFSIFKVIHPGVFTTKSRFVDDYCVTQLQRVAGGRKVPVIVGYKNLDKFRAVIDPYFLGRAKHAVSNELPSLTTREITCEMSPAEVKKYQEALSGILELGDGEIKEFEDTKALTSLIYCQEVVDSLTLLKFTGGDEITLNLYHDEKVSVKDMGGKETALMDLLTTEFENQKVIVYTRFERLVGRLQTILEQNGIKSVRITGKEKSEQRAAGQALFQKQDSGVDVIFITSAGSEAINLQAAAATIFYDSPWSWGEYVQLLGRMIRIGSPHPSVLAYHLVATLPATSKKNQQTIDHHVLKLLGKKKALIDQIIGEAAKGALTFEDSKPGGDLRALVDSMVSDLGAQPSFDLSSPV